MKLFRSKISRISLLSAQIQSRLLISTSNLKNDSLKGRVVIVTGGGRGIGFEASRALLWLGAKVIIAEMDETTGTLAERNFRSEFGSGREVAFVKTDLANEDDILRLEEFVRQDFGKADIVLNNAAALPTGDVKDAPISSWDLSYRVNLRPLFC